LALDGFAGGTVGAVEPFGEFCELDFVLDADVGDGNGDSSLAESCDPVMAAEGHQGLGDRFIESCGGDFDGVGHIVENSSTKPSASFSPQANSCLPPPPCICKKSLQAVESKGSEGAILYKERGKREIANDLHVSAYRHFDLNLVSEELPQNSNRGQHCAIDGDYRGDDL
jgi:hypothetical protein